MASKLLPTFFFLIFTVSGFSGLIYESIWSHYLKLFLGHAAYAQSLVLVIFMGGMALGAWICYKYSRNWKNLILGYAVVEGIIGIFALVFHDVFILTTEFTYGSILPTFNNPTTAHTLQWLISSFLILPQSILLGMTFPLMSSGFIRWFPERPGASLSMLYFTNTIGASVGVLVSGFILINWVGLPGTIRFAGIINIILAIVTGLLAQKFPSGNKINDQPQGFSRTSKGFGFEVFLLASFITGCASFMYEIGWIRMLSMVLGSSTHSFELMLSAFLIGLAFGSFWIKRRIDSLKSPVFFLGMVQILMGLLALATLPLYGNTFKIMQLFISALKQTTFAYFLFNLSGHMIALFIMVPTAFLAGMTLPLITNILLHQGSGEKSIGAVYASNTLGAIIGIFFAIHIGMPILGLKGLITMGAILDIGLGLVLIWGLYFFSHIKRFWVPVFSTVIGVIAILFWPQLKYHYQ